MLLSGGLLYTINDDDEDEDDEDDVISWKNKNWKTSMTLTCHI